MSAKNMVFVHAGAGFHSTFKEEEYGTVCSKACKEAMALLVKGLSAVEAVVQAVKVLEDSSITNAGLGSSLTLDGTVECDASVMDGNSSLFGAVGALSGFKNPICVAKKLLDGQKKRLDLGRIPPSFLVGSGANTWARQNGCEQVSEGALITKSSLKTYRRFKMKLDEYQDSQTKKRSLNEEQELDDEDNVQDTVGAICLDSEGHLAAAVSSGGILLKQPGRLGQACVFGSGCWAENGGTTPGVAVSTSGCGEHLMRTLLARECARSLSSQQPASLSISQTFRDKFLDSKMLQDIEEKLGGVIAVKCQGETTDREVEIVWAHTTASMCIGYMVEGTSHPKTFVSRLPEHGISGQSFSMQGKHFHVYKKP